MRPSLHHILEIRGWPLAAQLRLPSAKAATAKTMTRKTPAEMVALWYLPWVLASSTRSTAGWSGKERKVRIRMSPAEEEGGVPRQVTAPRAGCLGGGEEGRAREGLSGN